MEACVGSVGLDPDPGPAGPDTIKSGSAWDGRVCGGGAVQKRRGGFFGWRRVKREDWIQEGGGMGNGRTHNILRPLPAGLALYQASWICASLTNGTAYTLGFMHLYKDNS